MTDQIPYDEMRRLCGLPDVRAYCVLRDLLKAFSQVGTAVSRAWESGVIAHLLCGSPPVERAEDYALAGRKP